MNIKVLLRKNGPLLFTIGAGMTLVGAVVTAFRAGFNVAADAVEMNNEKMEITEKTEARRKEDNPAYNERLDEELKKNIVDLHCNHALTWGKECVLPLGLTGVSLFCMYKGQKLNAKALAAIGAGYAALSKKSDIIEGKIRQFIGEYKQDEFDEEMAQDWIDRSPVTSNGAVIETGKGNELFFDSFSGRYFLSDKEFVARAIELAEQDLQKGRGRYGMVLNDWYYNYLEIPTVELGGYFRFPKETFHVDLVRAPCSEKAVAPYCWVLKYTDVDTI